VSHLKSNTFFIPGEELSNGLFEANMLQNSVS